MVSYPADSCHSLGMRPMTKRADVLHNDKRIMRLLGQNRRCASSQNWAAMCRSPADQTLLAISDQFTVRRTRTSEPYPSRGIAHRASAAQARHSTSGGAKESSLDISPDRPVCGGLAIQMRLRSAANVLQWPGAPGTRSSISQTILPLVSHGHWIIRAPLRSAPPSTARQ